MHLSRFRGVPKVAPNRMIGDPFVDVVLARSQRSQRTGIATPTTSPSAQHGARERRGGHESEGAERVSTLKCSVCGAFNARPQKFCGDCGARHRELRSPYSARSTSPRRSLRAALTQLRDPSEGGRHEVQVSSHSRRARGRSRVARRAAESRRRRLVWLPALSATTGWADAPSQRVSASLRAAGDVVVQTGPTRRGRSRLFCPSRAVRALADVARGCGVLRDWAAVSAEARRGIADVFEKTERRLRRA